MIGFAARIGAALLALGAWLPAAASADPLRDGTEAFSNKDSATAMRLLAPLAAAGDPIAECMVTIMRDQAGGRVAYDVEGMSWNCIAASYGKASAELDLAGDYRSGLIVKKDVVKAATLYTRAAEHGMAVAQKVLGDLYAEGIGVKPDLATACRWWGRAAMQGESAEAERAFGRCYLSGTGVPRSEVQALAWWLIARNAESGPRLGGLPAWVFQSDADADRLADALQHRMPPDQVAQAQAFARAWKPKIE